MDQDLDFTRFKRLQLNISSASIYNMDVIMEDKSLNVTIAKLLVIRECHLCGSVGPDILFHLVGEFQYTRQQLRSGLLISSLRDFELR